MRIEPILSTDAFLELEDLVHLGAGGEAPWLKVHSDVYHEFARLKSAGHSGREENVRRSESCREKMGQLWGVDRQRIAWMTSSADGMSVLARGLDWRAGDNVVTVNIEFPSVAYAWKQPGKNIEVRRLPHRQGMISEVDLLEALDARTRVLAVSHVSFYSGQCLDLARLAEETRKRGVLLAVDATHSSGVLQVPASLTDLTVSSSYKWMLATHGVAPCYWSPRAEGQLQVTSFGWHNLEAWPEPAHSAENLPDVPIKAMPARLEPGNPPLLVIAFLDNALGLLTGIGMDRIENHARALVGLLREELAKVGFTALGPSSRSALSGNTSFPVADPEGLRDRLLRHRVLCWGGLGRLRVSTHLYNGSEDVYRFLSALRQVMG